MSTGIIRANDELFVSLDIIWEREQVRSPDLWQTSGVGQQFQMTSIKSRVPRITDNIQTKPWHGGARLEQGIVHSDFEWESKLFEATCAIDRDEMRDINRFGDLIDKTASMGKSVSRFRNTNVFGFLETALTADEFVIDVLGDSHTFPTLAHDDVRLFGTHPNNNEQIPGNEYLNIDNGGGDPFWYLSDSESLAPVFVGQDRDFEFYEFENEFRSSNRRKWGHDGRFSFAAGDPRAIFASNQALTDAFFDAARTSMAEFKLEDGTPSNNEPDTLIVSGANERAGREVLRERQANGADNVFAGITRLVVVRYLSA